MKAYSRKGLSPRCVVKINLKKVYDYIEWCFVENMMLEVGFPFKFVQWVMKCITTVTYPILFNGKHLAPFKASKGLRQGDPMSRCLIAIGMKYLSRCVVTLCDNRDCGFHPKCKKNNSLTFC